MIRGRGGYYGGGEIILWQAETDYYRQLKSFLFFPQDISSIFLWKSLWEWKGDGKSFGVRRGWWVMIREHRKLNP